MAPRESKVTPKVQRVNTTNTTKKPAPRNDMKVPITRKALSSKETPLKSKVNDIKTLGQQGINSVPVTPKPNDKKAVPCPGSVTKSAKKSWKRRPKPAHSGVPVPDKMKKLLQLRSHDTD